MTKGEARSLFISLQNLGVLTGVKFCYAVAKNIRLLLPEIESLNEACAMSKEYQTFENLRVESAKKHAKKDDKGLPVIIDKVYQFEDEKAANDAFENLKAEHKAAIDARDRQMKEFSELLKTESSVALHQVKLEDIPTQITSEKMEGIFDMIQE